MLPRVAVEQCEDGARIGDDQSLPKPLASSSSARSANVGSPLATTPLVGLRRRRVY
jgi:hypothetical protein